jgi:hypothetical protein
MEERTLFTHSYYHGGGELFNAPELYIADAIIVQQMPHGSGRPIPDSAEETTAKNNRYVFCEHIHLSKRMMIMVKLAQPTRELFDKIYGYWPDSCQIINRTRVEKPHSVVKIGGRSTSSNGYVHTMDAIAGAVNMDEMHQYIGKLLMAHEMTEERRQIVENWIAARPKP